MNKTQLIELAANSQQLKSYCKTLCRGRDIYNDLFQEFLLNLLQREEKFLIDKFENITFISFCRFTIYKMNLNRYVANKLVNTKNPLSEKYVENTSRFDTENDEGYNHEIDIKFNKTMEFLEQTPKVKKYQVAILFHSVTRTTKDIAKSINAPQRQVIYQNNKLKELIKQNVK